MDALTAKLVCLINLKSFDEALSLMTTKSPLANCHFERGYCPFPALPKMLRSNPSLFPL